MEMQERIDALIRMRKEKPDLKDQWDRLKGRLLRLIPETKTHELNNAFEKIEFNEAVERYDQLFNEVLIVGKKAQQSLDEMIMVDEDRGFGAVPIKAEGSRVTLGGNVGTGTWASATSTVKHTVTDEMIKAYTEYKKDKATKHAK